MHTRRFRRGVRRAARVRRVASYTKGQCSSGSLHSSNRSIAIQDSDLVYLIQSAENPTLERLTKRTRTARSCRPSVVSRRARCQSLSEFVRPRSLLNHQQWRWPMTREEFRAKWSARRAEWEKLGVLLSAAKLCDEFHRRLRRRTYFA